MNHQFASVVVSCDDDIRHVSRGAGCMTCEVKGQNARNGHDEGGRGVLVLVRRYW